MPYPFSITRKVQIESSNTNPIELIRIFKSELNKLDGIKFNVKNNKIKITECLEFSSRGLRLKNLNKGYISFDKKNGQVVICNS